MLAALADDISLKLPAPTMLPTNEIGFRCRGRAIATEARTPPSSERTKGAEARVVAQRRTGPPRRRTPGRQSRAAPADRPVPRPRRPGPTPGRPAGRRG